MSRGVEVVNVKCCGRSDDVAWVLVLPNTCMYQTRGPPTKNMNVHARYVPPGLYVVPSRSGAAVGILYRACPYYLIKVQKSLSRIAKILR